MVQDINKGEKLNKSNIRRIRPGFGLHPKKYDDVLGLKAMKDLRSGTPLKEEDFG